MSHPICSVRYMAEETCSDQIIDASSRRRLRATLPSAVRSLYVDVLRDTMRHGVPVDPTALIVVLGAHTEMSRAETEADVLHFTSTHVSELLWFGIHEFCEDQDLVVPDGCVDALHAALATATATACLSSTSDGATELFTTLEGLRAS